MSFRLLGEQEDNISGLYHYVRKLEFGITYHLAKKSGKIEDTHNR